MKKNSTLMNKIVAVLLLIGSFIVMICEKEGTSFALMCCVSIPLFFAKINCFTMN